MRSGAVPGCAIVFALTAGALLFVFYGGYAAVREVPFDPPRAIAHRGGAALGPENTLVAMRRSIEAGARWLEFDVRRTRDGVLVLMHDERVDRTTNGSGEVGAMTYEALRELDAGDGERVPTLDEVAALARESGAGMAPEIKSPELYPGIEAQLARAIRDWGLSGAALVQSFDPAALARIREEDSEIPVCDLHGLGEIDVSAGGPDAADAVCPMAEMVLVNPWIVRKAHRHGVKVYPWFGPLESPASIRLLLWLGVDGLIVDDPTDMASPSLAVSPPWAHSYRSASPDAVATTR